MSFVFKHKGVISLLFSLLYTVFVLPITESIWFTPVTDRSAILYSYLLKFLFGIALFGVAWFVLHFAEQLKKGSQLHKKWLLYSVIFGVFLLGFLLLIWPGYWVWDEFWVLQASASYTVHSWQHVFTQVQYILSLYLIPSTLGITIIQLTAISVIVGYVAAYIQSLLQKKWLTLFILLPLLSLPAILSDFYTLRLNIYAYLLLLLFINIIRVYRGEFQKHRYAIFIGLSLLVSILAFWRTEGVLYLITLPFIAYWLGLTREILTKARIRSILSILAALIFIGVSYTATKLTAIPYYQLTATVNPLSLMIHDDLSGKNITDDWKKISEVLDLDVLRQYPSYTEIPSMWISNGRSVLQPNYENHLADYYSGVKDILLSNPGLFLKYKAKTFLATNNINFDNTDIAWGAWSGFLTTYSTSGCAQLNAQQCTLLTDFDTRNKFSDPINATLRKDTLAVLLQQENTQSHSTLLRSLIWNVIPTIILCIALLLHSAFKKRWMWAGLFVLLLAHASLVFLTAPAIYFMYYFPIFLVGGIISIFYIILHTDMRITQRKQSIAPPAAATSVNSPLDHRKVLIAIPAYNCAPQITRVLRGIDSKLYDRVAEIAIIDNGSTDDTVKVALEYKKKSKRSKIHVYKNVANYNLGGTHKVAFNKAREQGFTHVVILHGDDQAKSSEANLLLDFAETHPQQTVLGSRFNKNSRLVGYDKKRIFGNKVLNLIYSTLVFRNLEDLGSGLNLFFINDLDQKTYLKFADKLTFNYELILDLVKRKVNFAFFPITWSEEDQVSNARNVTIFKTALINVIRWRINRPTVNKVQKQYSCKEIKR